MLFNYDLTIEKNPIQMINLIHTPVTPKCNDTNFESSTSCKKIFKIKI